jgi:hypothetical protein
MTKIKIQNNIVATAHEVIVMKKGRKPKGGKLTIKQSDKVEKFNQVTNIILHLKCNMHNLELYNNDYNKFIKNPLEYDPTEPTIIQSYSESDVFTSYHCNDSRDNDNTVLPLIQECENEMCIHEKLRKIKINLYKNCVENKKSACFWCTYEFDNPSCYIPKYEMDGTMFGYGAFCRPECAVAYLMKENVDDSTKFERYHLLNHVYGKVYDYKKNIKPA